MARRISGKGKSRAGVAADGGCLEQDPGRAAKRTYQAVAGEQRNTIPLADAMGEQPLLEQQ